MERYEDYLNARFVPRIETLERKLAEAERHIHNLETKFTAPPYIDVEVSGTNSDDVVATMKNIYQNFKCANLRMKVTLAETTTAGGD